MALNSQHKRISKNRVSITYDVETNGAIETRELPFVVGVIGEFSGDKPSDQKSDPEDRSFIGIDKDNFDDVMAKVGPKLSYKVSNKLTEEDTEFAVDLDFKSMRDFHPEALVENIEPLQRMVEVRNKLKILLSKADRSRDLERLLKEVLQEPKAIESMAKELGVDKEAE